MKYEEIQRLMEEERERHRVATETLNKQLKQLQDQCEHRNTKYWPDPWSSYYECLDCGKERVRPYDGKTRRQRS